MQSVPAMMTAAFATIGLLMYVIKRCFLKRTHRQSSSQLHSITNAFIMTIDLLYITLVEKTVQIFDCSQNNDGRFYLDAAPGIECFTDDYYDNYLPWGVLFMLVHVIGIPLLFSGILWHNRHDIMRDQLACVWGHDTDPVYRLRAVAKTRTARDTQQRRRCRGSGCRSRSTIQTSPRPGLCTT